MRFLHWLLVKCRVLRIPMGSRVQYCSMYKKDGPMGVVVMQHKWSYYDIKLELDGYHLHRDRLRFLSLPPRLSRFDRLVQSYIRSELRS